MDVTSTAGFPRSDQAAAAQSFPPVAQTTCDRVTVLLLLSYARDALLFNVLMGAQAQLPNCQL